MTEFILGYLLGHSLQSFIMVSELSQIQSHFHYLAILSFSRFEKYSDTSDTRSHDQCLAPNTDIILTLEILARSTKLSYDHCKLFLDILLSS